jgi:hypothetical protein
MGPWLAAVFAGCFITGVLVAAAETARSAETTNMERQKRKIPKVAPVSREGILYEVLGGAKERGFGQNGGVIAAISEAGKKELWTVVVYRVDFDPKEEEDVQEIYITKLALSKDGKQLVVDNERHKRFVVTLSDRSVVEAPGK